MKRFFCFIFLVLLFLPGRAEAQAFLTNWNGAVDGDWFTPGNWSNGVPSILVNPTISNIIGGVTAEITAPGAEADYTYVGSAFMVAGQSGSLLISNGGTLTNNSYGIVGNQVYGSAIVTGAGSAWLANQFVVGFGGFFGQGYGDLTIADGGNLTTTSFSINDAQSTTLVEDGGTVNTDGFSMGDGLVTVTGLGSSITVANAGWLNISSGTLRIENQGVVTGDGLILIGGGVAPVVEVDGVGSLISTISDFYVGVDIAFTGNAPGTLSITNGGLATGANMYVGLDALNGLVSIDGAGSEVQLSGTAYIGAMSIPYFGGGFFPGEGTMTLSAGGQLTATDVILGYADNTLQFDPGAVYHGILNIGAAPSDAAAAPGIVNAPTVSSGLDGTGEINFKHTDNAYQFDPDISGEVTVNTYAGTTIFAANQSYTGDTNVIGGVLFTDNDLETENLNLSLNGIFGGEARVIGDVANAGALSPAYGLAPGNYREMTVVGNYLGNNGQLLINTEVGDDTSQTDRLIIDGGNATGTTTVFITNTGGVGAETLADGIRIVQAINGATIDDDAFVLNGGSMQVGGYTYRLFQGGVDPLMDPYDFFLRQGALAASVPVYAATPELVMSYMRDTLGTVHDRMDLGDEMSLRSASLGFGGHENSLANLAAAEGVWVRAFGGQKKFESGDVANSGYEASFGGMQIGKDIYRADNDDGTRDRAGIYLAQGAVSADMTSSTGGTGKASFNATTAGGYWTRYAAKDIYYSLSGQYSHISAFKVRPTGANGISPSGHDVAVSAEAGKAIRVSAKMTLEPQAQLIYQHLKINDDNDGITDVRFDALNSVTGRVGARLSYATETVSGLSVQPWGRMNLIHTIAQDSTLVMGADTFKTPVGGTQAEIQAGFSLGRATKSQVGWSLYGNTGYQFAILGDPKTSGWNANIGVRLNW